MEQKTILLVILFVGCVNMTSERLFTKHGYICNIEQRRKLGCSKVVPRVRGFLGCFIQCHPEDFCVSVSVGDDGTCLHNQVCPSDVSCSHGDPTYQTWVRYCVHGHWNRTMRSCDCILGCSGLRCEKYPRLCADLFAEGFAHGAYRVLLDPDQDGLNPITAPCVLRANPYAHINLFGNTGRMNFNRTWDEYLNGFFIDVDNNWIGLRNWRGLSLAGCGHMFGVVKFEIDGDEPWVYHEYMNVLISDEASGYRLSFGSTTYPGQNGPVPTGASFGDCLSLARDHPFSTWDRDNDGSNGKNCAQWKGWGWWFSPGCPDQCNLLGWGLDNWHDTPTHQQLSLEGLDTHTHWDKIKAIAGYVYC